MRRILYSIDRWGPALVSVLTFLFLSAFGWSYSSKVARVEGQVTALQNQVNIHTQTENSLRAEMAAYKNWALAVYEHGTARGWELPQLPQEKIVKIEESKSKSKPKAQSKPQAQSQSKPINKEK